MLGAEHWGMRNKEGFGEKWFVINALEKEMKTICLSINSQHQSKKKERKMRKCLPLVARSETCKTN